MTMTMATGDDNNTVDSAMGSGARGYEDDNNDNDDDDDVDYDDDNSNGATGNGLQ